MVGGYPSTAIIISSQSFFNFTIQVFTKRKICDKINTRKAGKDYVWKESKVL